MRSILGTLLAITSLSATQSLAATSATLNISGTVDPILYIGFNATGTTTTNSISLSSSELLEGFTAKSGGTIYEVTNDASQDYRVTISSDNDGKIVHDTVATSFVTYTLNYGALSNQSLATDIEVDVDTSAFVALTTTPRVVSITSAGNDEALAGDYEDEITFTIAPN